MTELIAVLPAAGRGTRLGPTPSSKEILPLGFDRSRSGLADHRGSAGATGQAGKAGWRPVTTIESHLYAVRLAGCERAIVILGHGKYDIMDYLGSGSRYGVRISYLFQDELRGMPFALDLARPWARDAISLFAMPDTLIEPADTMNRLKRAHLAAGADLSLGLFETTRPAKFGMVALNDKQQITGFVDKPRHSTLHLMWGMAAWSPAFAEFMGEYLARIGAGAPEVVLSDVFAQALRAGLRLNPVMLDGASYNDIGTPEEFQHVVHRLATGNTGNTGNTGHVERTGRTGPNADSRDAGHARDALVTGREEGASNTERADGCANDSNASKAWLHASRSDVIAPVVLEWPPLTLVRAGR